MHMTYLETGRIPADFARKLVRGASSWLQRVVMTDVNILAFQFASVGFEDMVFHDVRVVVKIVHRKIADDLSHFGGDLDFTQGSDLRGRLAGTPSAREGQQQWKYKYCQKEARFHVYGLNFKSINVQ
jgi:hypothetical protein